MVVSRILTTAVLALSVALLAGCESTPLGGHEVGQLPGAQVPPARHPEMEHDVPALPPAGSGRGGYYKDDGPGENPPPNLREVPDAEVRAEPLSRFANRPYAVFGKTYTPIVGEQPFEQRGIASWYGKKFHGQRTSSGELYDMYKMTAAHPTLPIPSYARITSLDSGKQVVVRINDRGPFHASRVVDVSYTAALKLGLLSKGSHEVRVERILPNGAERGVAARRAGPETDFGLVNTMPVDVPPAFEVRRDAVAPAPMPAPMDGLTAGLTPGSTAASPSAPATDTPVAQFYLQLGAFSRADKAAEIRDQLAGALGSVEVVTSGVLHRIFSGPFASRDDALQALGRVPAALGLKPIVVRR